MNASVPEAARDLEHFAPAARRAISLAEAEARALGHHQLGTEHLLLGVLSDETDPAATVVRDAGASFAAARHKVAEAVGAHAMGTTPPPPALPPSARASRALVRAVRISHQRRSEDVTTHDLLLGVLDVEGTACLVLRGLGLDVDRVRDLLDQPARPSRAERSGPGATPDAGARVAAAVRSPACPQCAARLEDNLGWTVLTARAPGAPRTTRDAIAFTCAQCGHTLGVAPA